MSDLMQPVRFGNTGLRVSQMCLGTMMFGGATPLQEAQTIADMALDRGVFLNSHRRDGMHQFSDRREN